MQPLTQANPLWLLRTASLTLFAKLLQPMPFRLLARQHRALYVSLRLKLPKRRAMAKNR